MALHDDAPATPQLQYGTPLSSSVHTPLPHANEAHAVTCNTNAALAAKSTRALALAYPLPDPDDDDVFDDDDDDDEFDRAANCAINDAVACCSSALVVFVADAVPLLVSCVALPGTENDANKSTTDGWVSTM